MLKERRVNNSFPTSLSLAALIIRTAIRYSQSMIVVVSDVVTMSDFRNNHLPRNQMYSIAAGLNQEEAARKEKERDGFHEMPENPSEGRLLANRRLESSTTRYVATSTAPDSIDGEREF
ncbi:protein FAM163A-like protein [Anopheles sinensis]|uniref:Protein FAM163A-like protein n=1 Tax=Anopheles sinensis TaxID=74873 RepID=A0A084W5Z2_ANOSI|nr:protein FAM163A-like protein [Anopheles sinensis]